MVEEPVGPIRLRSGLKKECAVRHRGEFVERQVSPEIVVRENQTGRMGSFETDIDVPDLKAQPLKMSSVVLIRQEPTNAAP